MTPAFLIWLLPGYLVHLFHKAIHPVRNTSGWDFVALSGLYAAILYLASALTDLFVLRFMRGARAVVSGVGEALHLPVECHLVPLAFLFALGWGFIATRREGLRRRVWRMWPGDPYIEFTRHALETQQFTIITLRSGKVYVGVLAGATFDVNESTRSILLSLELSGYRQKDTHRVVFDKNYIPYDIVPRDRTILIPYAEISAMSPFSYDLHEKFVRTGVTLLRPADAETEGLAARVPADAVPATAVPDEDRDGEGATAH